MANPTIGVVICPMMGDSAEVRQDKNGKLYYSGLAGLITPKTPDGQRWLKSKTHFKGGEDDSQLTPVTDDDMTIEREPTARAGGLFDGLFESVFGGEDE
jgi:hypothetical protein